MSLRGPKIDDGVLFPQARVRVLYADTDRMGIVYHASYLRYLELARVELIRSAGLAYADFERRGVGLPVTEIAVRYIAPALYDDFMTIHAGVSLLTQVRVHFQYRIVVHAGDRAGPHRNPDDVEILTAETRHGCVRMDDGRPERFPPEVYEVLRNCYTRRAPPG